MKKIALIMIIVFLFVIPFSFSDGVCELDKVYPDAYYGGEIANFKCDCNDPQEENRAGYIVFLQSNGTVLSSVATNSGSCQTSFFGGPYIFPRGTNFTGNATFSLNADGTGDPPQWGGIEDIRSAEFNLSSASLVDCVISDIQVPDDVVLGWYNSNVFKVSDAITENPIVGINCVALAFDVDGTPILVEPYAHTYDNYRTVSGGTGYLTATFEENRFNVGQTYEFGLYCQCTNNSENDAVCYDGTTGERLGFKSCTVTGLFTVAEDKRYLEDNKENLTGTILIYIILIIFYGVFGFTTYKGNDPDVGRIDYWISFFCFSMATLMLLAGITVMHAYNTGANIKFIVDTTLIANAIIIFLGGFLLWVRHIIGMASFMSPELRKWDKGKWGPK